MRRKQGGDAVEREGRKKSSVVCGRLSRHSDKLLLVYFLSSVLSFLICGFFLN